MIGSPAVVVTATEMSLGASTEILLGTVANELAADRGATREAVTQGLYDFGWTDRPPPLLSR
jgi:hypothetical protein